jgi:murein L,D-transpeptidase YcbB/YkuD
VAAAIRAGVTNGRAALLSKPALARQKAELESLYQESWAPLWVDEAGRPTPAAADAIAAMRTALEDGLDTLDYSGGRLDSVATGLNQAATRAPAQVGQFDLALSAAFLRYMGDLHSGRIDPIKAGFKLEAPVDRHDVPALIRSALAEGSLTHGMTQRPPSSCTGASDRARPYRELAQRSDSVPAVTASSSGRRGWCRGSRRHLLFPVIGWP